MNSLFFWIGIFIISLTLLVKASDFLTDSAEKIGRSFRVPKFIIGVAIISVGTSLPELISSIFAVIDGNSEIVVSNVIGSNITNIFLIVGISSIIAKKIYIRRNLINVDLPIMISSTFLLGLIIFDGFIDFAEGIILILGGMIYVAYTLSSSKKDEEIIEDIKDDGFSLKPILVLFASAFFIFISARYTVTSIVEISELLNIGAEIIAVTVVALGTSLPELVVSISAIRKGSADLVIGNIIGSTIFNSLFVAGIPALIGTIFVPDIIISFTLPVAIVATLLFLFKTQEQRLTRWEGWFLILFYGFFVLKVLTT